jgi:hypothetical protein
VALLGVWVLLGWVIGNDFLKSFWLPAAMNPVSAVCFVLTGSALWLLRFYAWSGRYRLAGAACAAATLLLMALWAGGRLLGWGVRVDHLLFPDQLHGNGIAPNTAVSFTLSGIALLLLDARQHGLYRAAMAAALCATFIALLALTGYLYEVPTLTGVSGQMPMALNSALAFALLGIGILSPAPTASRSRRSSVTPTAAGSCAC